MFIRNLHKIPFPICLFLLHSINIWIT